MQIIELDDLSRPELAPCPADRSPAAKQAGPGAGLFIAESPKVIEKPWTPAASPSPMERRHIDGQGAGFWPGAEGSPSTPGTGSCWPS